MSSLYYINKSMYVYFWNKWNTWGNNNDPWPHDKYLWLNDKSKKLLFYKLYRLYLSEFFIDNMIDDPTTINIRNYRYLKHKINFAINGINLKSISGDPSIRYEEYLINSTMKREIADKLIELLDKYFNNTITPNEYKIIEPVFPKLKPREMFYEAVLIG